VDHVAVAVEQPVELPEGGGTVAAEDGEAGGPQPATADDLRALDCGRQRTAVEVWRPSPPAPGHRRVELLADRLQLVDDRPAFLAEDEEPGVQAAEPMNECIPLDLTVDAGPYRYPGGVSQLVERVALKAGVRVTASRRRAAHGQGVVIHQRSWGGARRWR
jgi:hypothetical protein